MSEVRSHGSLISGRERSAVRDAIARARAACCQSGKSGIAASVLLNGATVATVEDTVHLQSDPTRHAEMVAITRASRGLQTTDLSGCVMISTWQSCEMDLSAMRFSGIRRVIFAPTKDRVAAAYLAFPPLGIGDFQQGGDFEAVGGICGDQVLHLDASGAQ